MYKNYLAKLNPFHWTNSATSVNQTNQGGNGTPPPSTSTATPSTGGSAQVGSPGWTKQLQTNTHAQAAAQRRNALLARLRQDFADWEAALPPPYNVKNPDNPYADGTYQYTLFSMRRDFNSALDKIARNEKCISLSMDPLGGAPLPGKLLPWKLFRDLPGLTALDLSGHRIDRLPVDDLADAKELTHLAWGEQVVDRSWNLDAYRTGEPFFVLPQVTAGMLDSVEQLFARSSSLKHVRLEGFWRRPELQRMAAFNAAHPGLQMSRELELLEGPWNDPIQRREASVLAFQSRWKMPPDISRVLEITKEQHDRMLAKFLQDSSGQNRKMEIQSSYANYRTGNRDDGVLNHQVFVHICADAIARCRQDSPPAWMGLAMLQLDNHPDDSMLWTQYAEPFVKQVQQACDEAGLADAVGELALGCQFLVTGQDNVAVNEVMLRVIGILEKKLSDMQPPMPFSWSGKLYRGTPDDRMMPRERYLVIQEEARQDIREERQAKRPI